MKLKVLLIIVLSVAGLRGQTEYIEKFPIPENQLVLQRAAQNSQYFDKVGMKAAVMGSESGSFESWIWPWKLLRNFDLQFFLENSTNPIHSRDIVKTISVLPEATIFIYSYESFTVKEIMFIPVGEPAAVILLEVHTEVPLSIVPGFIPVMQPQWPAGIGGQYSYWDENIKAFVISESQHRGLFLCGSPLGKRMTEPPAHMFAESPMQFRIETDKDNSAKGYIPIIIAGSPVKSSYDSVKTLYKSIVNRIPELFKKNTDYYRELKDKTLSLRTPVKEINLAFEWGKIGLRNLLVENPSLGKGLVAGYGLSGTGGRPGFAWFFGGDAFINSLAMNSFQDYQTVKDALSFTQKWQRQDNYPIKKKKPHDKNTEVGKIAHELSQSDGLIDWWNDYHFGYNHADTSPWYILALGDYYSHTNDTAFIKQSWNSIKQAYQWCLSKDSNNDGLMDLKGAGLGVLEFGKLVNIHNDIYTQVLWTQALKEMIQISELNNDYDIRNQSETLLHKALKSLEEIYWMNDSGYYSFGANEYKEQVKEKSIYSSSALFFKLLDSKRSVSTLKSFNTSEMITAWGVRNLSDKSELYNPSNYNYGTVWPFTSFMIGTAEFNYNFNFQGYQILLSTLNNIFNYGLGVSPEVLSGNFNNKLSEAYHNQGFSYTGFILPMVKGLLGLEVNAPSKLIRFSPKFPPDWDNVAIENININKSELSINYIKESGKINIEIVKAGDEQVYMDLNPVLAPGVVFNSLTINGEEHHFNQNQTQYASEISIKFLVLQKNSIELKFEQVPEIFLIPSSLPAGSINKTFILKSQEYINGRLHLFTEVFDGETYELGVTNPGGIKKLTGAVLDGNKIIIKSEFTGSENYNEKEIIIEIN